MYIMSKLLSYTEAIKEATKFLLGSRDDVYVMGLGVSYLNGADGTMGNLKEIYPNRVFDTPVSEFCNTSVGVGSAITGMRPIIHHARVEFSLFAIDSIINQSAKWNYMFGGNNPAPIVFRIALGRQWGNGPQHTQSLINLFASTPGLKVVIPSTPRMAKNLLISAALDNNPVVYLESRWLYGIKQNVEDFYQPVSLSESRYVTRGNDATIVSYGDGIIAALEAKKLLEEFSDITIEIIDLVSINPIDYSKILQSLEKTKTLICVDTTPQPFSVGSEIISSVCKTMTLKKISHLTTQNCPCPTSTKLTENYYPTKIDIANTVLRQCNNKQILDTKLTFEELHILPKIILEDNL